MPKKKEVVVKKEKGVKKPVSRDTGRAAVKEKFTEAFLRHLYYTQGRVPEVATPNDLYMAVSYAVRDQILDRWFHTVQNYSKPGVRIVSYLSAEFLLGPHLENNLVNLGIYDEVTESMKDLGLDLRRMIDQEEEPGLGNGGLGRLAACYMDSLATLEIPSVGYGIRYEFGILTRGSRTAGRRR